MARRCRKHHSVGNKRVRHSVRDALLPSPPPRPCPPRYSVFRPPPLRLPAPVLRRALSLRPSPDPIAPMLYSTHAPPASSPLFHPCSRRDSCTVSLFETARAGSITHSRPWARSACGGWRLVPCSVVAQALSVFGHTGRSVKPWHTYPYFHYFFLFLKFLGNGPRRLSHVSGDLIGSG